MNSNRGDTPGLKKVVLIADDNVDAAETLRTLLSFSAHTVHVVHDGLAAMSFAEELRPELVVLDIGMPGADGYEVARWIRGQSWGNGPRLVALTAWATADDIQKSRNAGFDAHLRKPAGLAELQQALGIKIG
jgi:CheY-like chemotaxis protein